MARRPQQPQEDRIHYIPEWADRRGYRSQADLLQALEGLVDKSTVSRWYGGALPDKPHLEALRILFELEELAALFRHPDDDWLAKFFRDRSAEERAIMRRMIEAALSPKTRAG